jgi:phospholipid/cholesterol/gamma-HCH transport system substrate-binding protein
MRRAAQRGRFTAYQVGLIAIVLLVIAVFLAFTKDIPFTTPFQVSAVFENAPPIQKNTAVRIAGVEVGKVSDVQAVGGDSPAVKVTIKLQDDALPLHEDAVIKARPRIFFEGNLFLDVSPGTPGAETVEDGHTFPVSQTSAPVQIDQVLGTLTSDTREDLQKLLKGYGEAVNGAPQEGEDEDQDPSTEGQTAGQSLNDSLEFSADALRGTAIVNDALLGAELHDLSKLIGGQQKVMAALSSNESQLKSLITNFNVTMGALAAEQDNLRETVRLLPRVLEAARPALDNLNAAFPSTRAWALEMVPGVRETPATIDAAFPWIDQTRALLSKAELRGLVDDLSPAVDDFAQFTNGQLDLLPEIDLFNRCQYEVVLPTGEQVIEDGNLSTGIESYKEFWQAMVGLAGESANFTGNGNYVRFQAGGGGFPINTGPVGRSGQFFANATAAPLGTRPARSPKPPYRPRFACHRNDPADLNAARIGGGP